MGDRLVPAFTGLAPLATGILWPWLLLAAGWLLLAHRHGTLHRTRALAVALVGLSAGLLAFRGTGRAPDTLSMEAIDVGQGDALLVRVPNGDTTLVDTGASPWTARRVARVLSRRGVREPVHLVLTHPHGDHAGGWATLARLWPLASTSAPVTADDDDPWAPFSPPNADPSGLLRGDAWTRGDAAFSVRWPARAYALPDANMVSAVLRVAWRDRELWLMGDALGIQERDLLDLGEPGPFAHRVLKAGHHGSRTASDPTWVAALRPEVAVVSAGLRNRFDHPHPETLETFRKEGVEAWISGPCRGVRTSAVPGGWQIETGDGTAAFIPFRKSPSP
jgi:competence protein ComEC